MCLIPLLSRFQWQYHSDNKCTIIGAKRRFYNVPLFKILPLDNTTLPQDNTPPRVYLVFPPCVLAPLHTLQHYYIILASLQKWLLITFNTYHYFSIGLLCTFTDCCKFLCTCTCIYWKSPFFPGSGKMSLILVTTRNLPSIQPLMQGMTCTLRICRHSDRDQSYIIYCNLLT